ncbi:pilus assembly protein [Lysobacter sp. GCM10012299]|uniref:pilus assembly protein n=1 Tax=Lysobacter sp. GCM10012299 TaxID=3317333 RepID=UPI0036231A44
MEGRRCSRSGNRKWVSSLIVALIAIAAITGAANAQVQISQAPLYVGPRVPGNLALVPSVEYPTINSQANIGRYDVNRTYLGYFDADKCYNYHYAAIESQRHFYPVRFTQGHVCSYSRKEWSGNLMNWAVTQTVDPFRLALTGGYRVVDTPTETWLEKARHDRGYGFSDRRVPDGGPGDINALRAATPASWNWMWVQVAGRGNKMRFTGRNFWGALVAYDPATHDLVLDNRGNATPGNAFEVSVRVKVCVANLLEANCKRYSQGWKPEGLVQAYSDRVRYSIFGYLNDSSVRRDGGVLRAEQKFVGPQTHDPATGPAANAAREWDPDTGVIFTNPDPGAAAATPGGVRDSGVINYLNKFGQLTSQFHKGIDPVSELYYAAIRYFKNQGNVAAYSTITGNAYDQVDGFPVITRWRDPVQYRCQANVILGIGDVNTHRDKNLPGNTNLSEEPATPPEVRADRTVNVVTATNKVAELEKLRIGTPFSGRNNSAYIAGLAYDSHTRDIRPDLDGLQTVATHWVDVRENATLAPRESNQYWLAAKYGGFRVPNGYRPYERTDALPEAWWYESGDILAAGYKRPDNFYVASEADKMVESLTRAFRRIVQEASGSAASLAANTTRREIGAMIYQARFQSPSWRGELSAYPWDPATGAFSVEPAWNAGDRLSAMPWARRKIHVHTRQAAANLRYQPLTWNALGPEQRSALGDEATVDYLRGDRRSEGRLRTRLGILGDIVHSQPVFVGRPEALLYSGGTFAGASSYAHFADSQANRRGVVYVGANDGMLHGFDAETGDEVYAFMPAAAINAYLKTLASPDYEHRFFVDGELSVADVYAAADRRWKTILVGSMGRGGKAVFALDVTDPDNVNFLWEKDASDIPALGHVLGKPILAQVANGDWRVLLGNGPNSAGGTAQLITIGIESGVAQVITTGTAGNNALSAVDAWDTNRDGFFETVYAGDLAGNLWRFSGVGGAAASVGKLFTAEGSDGKRQPITAAPLVTRNPKTRAVWVFFGTGRYLGDADVADKSVQAWYGLVDDGDEVKGRTALVRHRILAELPAGKGQVLRVTTKATAEDFVGKDGWELELVSPVNGREGERMVVPNQLDRGMLIGTTRIPDARDICSPGGRGFIMALEPFTGSRPSSSFIDANGDGLVDERDMVKVDGVMVPASGTGFGSSPIGPTILDGSIQVNLEDGTVQDLRTRNTGTRASRVSWRELLLD